MLLASGTLPFSHGTGAVVPADAQMEPSGQARQVSVPAPVLSTSL
jgi:hypothetical protein